jgi:hypothetical protein
MIAAIAIIAEMRIKEAVERGELDGLPGAGRPLPLDEDANVPEDLRMAYKLLKNGGYLEEAIGQGKPEDNPRALGDLLPANSVERVTLRRMLKLQVIEARTLSRHGQSLKLDTDEAYHAKVVERISVVDRETSK